MKQGRKEGRMEGRKEGRGIERRQRRGGGEKVDKRKRTVERETGKRESRFKQW